MADKVTERAWDAGAKMTSEGPDMVFISELRKNYTGLEAADSSEKAIQDFPEVTKNPTPAHEIAATEMAMDKKPLNDANKETGVKKAKKALKLTKSALQSNGNHDKKKKETAKEVGTAAFKGPTMRAMPASAKKRFEQRNLLSSTPKDAPPVIVPKPPPRNKTAKAALINRLPSVTETEDGKPESKSDTEGKGEGAKPESNGETDGTKPEIGDSKVEKKVEANGADEPQNEDTDEPKNKDAAIVTDTVDQADAEMMTDSIKEDGHRPNNTEIKVYITASSQTETFTPRFVVAATQTEEPLTPALPKMVTVEVQTDDLIVDYAVAKHNGGDQNGEEDSDLGKKDLEKEKETIEKEKEMEVEDKASEEVISYTPRRTIRRSLGRASLHPQTGEEKSVCPPTPEVFATPMATPAAAYSRRLAQGRRQMLAQSSSNDELKKLSQKAKQIQDDIDGGNVMDGANFSPMKPPRKRKVDVHVDTPHPTAKRAAVEASCDHVKPVPIYGGEDQVARDIKSLEEESGSSATSYCSIM